MYVAVKGGEKAIDAAHALQESRRRGDTDLPELSVAQIEQQLNLAVDRVMTEGGIADRELAALALKQASGDNVEAIFLLRAYRTTLAKLAVSEPLDTTGMRLERRISAVYKDIPGGQLLGPTYDYTHRRTFSACWRVRGWRSLKRIAAHSRMTSPARRRFTPAHVLPVCSS